MANGDVKAVDIQIADDDLTTLKQNGYQVCFAKKVNDTYNVVWQSAGDYLSDNTFSWQPLYELFGSNKFEGDTAVQVSTNKMPIGLGEQSVLKDTGLLEKPSSGGPATGITLINQYGKIHPGLQSYAVGIDGRALTSPIYVAQNQIVTGSDVLTPVEVVQVWFEQDIATTTMFSTARSNAVEIDLTDENSQTRLYKGGGWSTPGLQARLAEVGTIVTIVAVLTAAIIIQQLTAKITSKLTGVYQNIQVKVTSAGGNSVQIKYQETVGLGHADQRYTQALLSNKTTVDQLTAFAVESFAQLGVGYISLNGSTA